MPNLIGKSPKSDGRPSVTQAIAQPYLTPASADFLQVKVMDKTLLGNSVFPNFPSIVTKGNTIGGKQCCHVNMYKTYPRSVQVGSKIRLVCFLGMFYI